MARVKYISREDLPESQQHIYDEIATSRGMKKLPTLFEALLNSPEGVQIVAALGGYLRFKSKLPPAVREMVSSAIAWQLKCELEGVIHGRAAQQAGVSEATIAAIREGKSLKGLPESEAIYLRFAYELFRNHDITDATFKPVFEKLGAQNTTDLIFLVGYYNLFVSSVTALRVEMPPVPPPPPGTK